MSVQAGLPWQWNDWVIEGLSLSGIRTSLHLPKLGIVFDVAQGFPYVLLAKHYFISHGHLDHAAGIPYIISQKAMNSHPAPRFYMPESLIEPMTQIMKLWESIEKHEYDYHFIKAEDQVAIPLNNQYEIEPFKTVHRIDSCGYTLFEKKKSLNPSFANLDKGQLNKLRAEGTDLNLIERTPLISFTGDTQIEFLDISPQVLNSKVLILEATYLDERKTISKAKEWGHTHLDEIIERLDLIKSEKIVLIHISSRYSISEIQKIVDAKVPKEHRQRIEIFPGR